MTTTQFHILDHRVQASDARSVQAGTVSYSPVKSIWFSGMLLASVVGGLTYFTWAAFVLFIISTGVVLLFGHSLGSHRKLIHNSFSYP